MNKKTKIILIIVLIVAVIALIILLLHPWKSNKSDGTEYYMSKNITIGLRWIMVKQL